MRRMMKPTRKQNKKNPVSQMQKSPYEKARDANVRQRKELEKELKCPYQIIVILTQMVMLYEEIKT